ncbi:MAG: hypothetical protein SF339_15960 [Blastocatellia bacterium]|nr:hypothetical protein [Blastocatellia bacterium]
MKKKNGTISAIQSRAPTIPLFPVLPFFFFFAIANRALIIDSATMKQEIGHRATETQRKPGKLDLLSSQLRASVALWQPSNHYGKSLWQIIMANHYGKSLWQIIMAETLI